jgi:hypothetical protein
MMARVELDSNTVERSMRPLALNRKNALFAGSDEGGDMRPRRNVEGDLLEMHAHRLGGSNTQIMGGMPPMI